MSQKTKHEASMSRLPGNRSAKFVPYLIPGLIGLFAVVVVPFIWNIYLSFTRWRGVGPVKWVGLKNWKRLFSDSTFWISFANSFWIIVAIVVIPTILGLFISSLLTDVIQKKFGGKTASFLRALFYLPQLLPVAVAAIIMGWIFRPEDGAVNALLAKIGLGALQHNWLGSPSTALGAVTLVAVWKEAGFFMIFYLAALQTLNPSLKEAAAIEGASRWYFFRRVQWPLLMPTTLFVLVNAVINAFRLVDHIFILTRGGPDNATSLLLYHLYEVGFKFWDTAYAAAITVVLVVVLAGVALFQFFVLDKKVHYQ